MSTLSRTGILVLLTAMVITAVWVGSGTIATADEMEQVIQGPRTTESAPAPSSKPVQKTWWTRFKEGIGNFFHSLFGSLFGGRPDPRPGWVNAPSGLNVRTGPGVDYDRTGYFQNGAKITILDEKKGWYLVDYQGDEAWVSEKYVDTFERDISPPSERPWEPPEEEKIGDFSYEHIMSDTLFTDVNSMSKREIQSFLERKGSALAKPYRGEQPSQLIYDACRKYGISPKIMLARLQTEQGLVSKRNATQRQLDWAFGVGCYDGGNWNTRYKGLRKQISYAASTMKTHYLKGRQTIRENGPVSMRIDGRRVSVKNAATYSLYKYTPHLQGNRLFYDVFAGYFAALLLFLLNLVAII